MKTYDSTKLAVELKSDNVQYINFVACYGDLLVLFIVPPHTRNKANTVP